MPSYKRLTENQKREILLLKELNCRNCDIATKVNCHPASVGRFLKKYEVNGQITGRQYHGKARILNARDESHLKRLCLQQRFTSASKLRVEMQKVMDKPCSTRTIQRRLNDMGLKSCRPAKKPLLTTAMRSSRLQWTKDHLLWTDNQWKNVIFSDETKINLFGADGGQRVRRRSGERFSSECIQNTVKHSPYVMVWGAVTFYGVGAIILLEGAVNADKYKKIIEEGVVPTIEALSEHTSSVVFQDDSAPCHRAKSIQEFKTELGITSLSWPANSPDLNIIENVWSVMKRKVREKEPGTIAELKEVVKDVWTNEISTNYLQKLYKSMPQRLRDIKNVKGGHINK